MELFISIYLCGRYLVQRKLQNSKKKIVFKSDFYSKMGSICTVFEYTFRLNLSKKVLVNLIFFVPIIVLSIFRNQMAAFTKLLISSEWFNKSLTLSKSFLVTDTVCCCFLLLSPALNDFKNFCFCVLQKQSVFVQSILSNSENGNLNH